MGFQISLCQFHKNSLSERLLDGKDVTLWDELTEHRAVSQKASFQFFTEDISFFTLGFYGPPNITFYIPQEQSKRKASWGESCNQKAFFEFLTEDISFFAIALCGLPNITLQIPQEQFYRKASWEESCKSVRWINRTQSSFTESFFSVFISGYFLFHPSPLWASKYHFENSTRTVLAKVFCRGKL